MLGDVKLARGFHLGNVKGRVSTFGCRKIRLQINYMLEKINIPQTPRKKDSLIVINLAHFQGFYRHITDEKQLRVFSETNLQKGSRDYMWLCSTGEHLVCGIPGKHVESGLSKPSASLLMTPNWEGW